MSDLDERFRSLGRTGVPDLWEEIGEREPRHGPGTGTGRRIVAGAVALFVATAGVGLAAWAFRAGERELRPTTTVTNGLLAFASGGDVWVVHPDGSGLTNVTNTRRPADAPDGCTYEVPWEWSPDGSRLAFYGSCDPPGSEGGANYDVFVMDADGGGRVNLTTSPEDVESGASQLNPHWSPDGTQITFDGDDGLYIVSADGSGLHKVADGGLSTWSPDGTSVAFVGDGGIYTADPDGSDPTQVTSEPGFEDLPAWSPAGDLIAFIASSAGGGHQLEVVRPDGGGRRRLTDLPNDGMGSPSWSPDGSRIALAVHEPGGSWDLYVVNADGSGVTQLTDGPGDETRPKWSPDGTKIAFMGSPTNESTNSGTFDVYTVDPDGTELTRITDGPGAAPGALTWQPVLDVGPNPSPEPDDGSAPFPAPFVPRVAGMIPVEFGGSMVFAYDSLWATVSANDGTGSGSLLRIDPATNEVVARIPDAAFSGWVAGGGGLAAGEGSIWATGGGELPDGRWVALLQRFDPDSNSVVASVVLDEGEWSQGQDVTVGGGGVWVVLGADEEEARDVVVRIDPATNEVVARIPLDLQWAHWIAATEDRVIVLEHRTFGDGARAGVFTTIDARTNEIVASVEPDLLGGAWGLVPLADDILTSAGGWDLARVDPISGDVVSLAIVLGVSAEGLAVGEGGVWFVGYNPNASNERPLTINRLNPDSGVVDVSAEIQRRGSAIAAGGGAVWIMTPDGILRIDLEPAPSQPVPAALEPFVAPMLAAFMEARIDGSGAENHFSSEGAEAWSTVGGGLQPLYSPTGLRYESFAITSVESLGDGTFEVGVRMFGAHLDGVDEWFTEPLFEETLFVGPGRDPNGDPRLLLVTGGRPGLDGP